MTITVPSQKLRNPNMQVKIVQVPRSQTHRHTRRCTQSQATQSHRHTWALGFVRWVRTARSKHRRDMSVIPAGSELYRAGARYAKRRLPASVLGLGRCKGQATLCVQSAQYRTRSSEIAFLRTVLVWLSTCIPYQLNIVSDYAIAQYRTNASDIAHFVRIV